MSEDLVDCNVVGPSVEMTSAERLAMDRHMSGLSQALKNAVPYAKTRATTAPDILDQAKAEQANRAQFYDAPAGERSMGKAIAAFNVMHGTRLTEVQGWQFMELLKMVRSSQGTPRLDNYVDGASYCALAGEAAMRTIGERT